jgi:hypothetical protein
MGSLDPQRYPVHVGWIDSGVLRIACRGFEHDGVADMGIANRIVDTLDARGTREGARGPSGPHLNYPQNPSDDWVSPERLPG